MNRKAVILLSGGLDSATCLAIANEQGYDCYTVSFDYGQRHLSELAAAKRVSEALGAKEHKVLTLGLRDIGGSALTDNALDVPTKIEADIPITYVPARNAIFLSLALAWAEILNARDIFIGANDIDYSGYPDCRSEFLNAFEIMANLATKAGVQGDHFHLHAPLLTLTKAEIIKEGDRLSIDYSSTISCYKADILGRACGLCASCHYRKKGFENAGLKDVTVYQN